jgi:hypothetical protein
VLTPVEIARVCHEANRALQHAQNDPNPSPGWGDAPGWQRDSSVAGVEAALAGASPVQLHDAWCEYKRQEGWVWGPVKDPEQKAHPSMRPYGELPEGERVKDALFHGIVRALAGTGTSFAGAGQRVTVRGMGDQSTVEVDDLEIRNVLAATVSTEPGVPMQRVSLEFLTDRASVLPTEAAL